MLLQKTIQLSGYKNGFHLITDIILAELPQLKEVKSGMLFLQLLHTSASLSLNENADPTVRHDLKTWAEHFVPRTGVLKYIHDYEGVDDMPAHILSSLFGVNLALAIRDGRLVLGTWQGIYFGEHRDHPSNRKIHCSLLS